MAHKSISDTPRLPALKSLFVIACLFAFATHAWSQSVERVIYNFIGEGAAGRLISDSHGNLYGVSHGSNKLFGSVFELLRVGNGRWMPKLLYKFTGGADGAYPEPGLVLDSAGNLYGATEVGGINPCDWTQPLTCGTVFQLTPTGQGQWTEKVLYNFPGGGGAAIPSTGLFADSAGNLYGATNLGGPNLFDGTIFRLTAQPDGSWSEEQLYTFTSSNTFGMSVSGPLVFDNSGNLYGATSSGGSGASCGDLTNGCGTVFELSPTIAGSWTYSLVYSFCSLANCSDGGFPNGVTVDDQGNLYGTTASGALPYMDGGTAFELSPAAKNVWNFTLLYTFCALSQCADGSRPSGAPIRDAFGNLYGPTIVGGTFKQGTVFDLSPSANGVWTLQTLYDFCPNSTCHDGLDPSGELTMDRAGNIYGATLGGGNLEHGVVFQIRP